STPAKATRQSPPVPPAGTPVATVIAWGGTGALLVEGRNPPRGGLPVPPERPEWAVRHLKYARSAKVGAALQGDALAPPRVEPGGRVKPVSVPLQRQRPGGHGGEHKAERAGTLRRRAAGRKAALKLSDCGLRARRLPDPELVEGSCSFSMARRFGGR